MRVPQRTRRKRFPVTPATKNVTWTIRNLVGDPFIQISANSLASFGHAISQLDLPGDRWVIIERNGQLIYRGPWKGDLPDAPTLM